MRYLFVTTLSLFCFLLSGCGFKPIYSNTDNADIIKLASINYDKLEKHPKYSRITYALNNSIDDIIKTAEVKANTNTKKYRLTIDYTMDISDYLIKSDTTASRKKIFMTLEYKLRDISKNNIVLQGKILSYDSFHIVKSPYANYLTQEEVATRMAVELASELKLQLLSRL